MRVATLEELAIEPSIRRLVSEFAESRGVSVRLEVDLAHELSPLPDVAHALYRAVQEGLTNVHKHAHASLVDVKLRGASESIVLEVCDDGVGAAPQRGQGNGLASGMVLLLDGPAATWAAALPLSMPLPSARGKQQRAAAA